jgi:Flp pilus assembly protein TadG
MSTRRRVVFAGLRRRVRTGHHDGGAIVIELSIVMPIMFTLLFAGTQAALLYQGRTVAIAAAEEGARAAAAQTGTAADGQDAATAFATSVGGGGVLQGVQVTATRDATTATVQVTGTTASLVPGWHPQTTGRASAPVERLTTG